MIISKILATFLLIASMFYLFTRNDTLTKFIGFVIIGCIRVLIW